MNRGVQFHLSEEAGDLWRDYAGRVGAPKSAVAEVLALRLMNGTPLDPAVAAFMATVETEARALAAARRSR